MPGLIQQIYLTQSEAKSAGMHYLIVPTAQKRIALPVVKNKSFFN